MLRNIFLAAFAAMFIANAASAADIHLKFEQFPAQTFTGEPAPLEWNHPYVPEDVAFKGYGPYEYAVTVSEIRFGGHYMLVRSTLGVGIPVAFLVDLRTGRWAADLPTAAEYDYRADSNLLVVNPATAQALSQREYHDHQVTEYHLWTGESFQPLAEEPWPALQVTVIQDDYLQSGPPIPMMRPDRPTTGTVN